MTRFSVDEGLDTLYVGLPGSVGSSVRVGDLDSEGNALSADIAFCHRSAPPFCAQYRITAIV